MFLCRDERLQSYDEHGKRDTRKQKSLESGLGAISSCVSYQDQLLHDDVLYLSKKKTN